MTTKACKWLLQLLLILIFSSFVHAGVEWNVYKNLQLESPPKQVKVSQNGKWIFVLDQNDSILIYSPDGFLKDMIIPDFEVSDMTPGYTDTTLLLSSAKDKSVRLINFSFIERIDTNNSPVRGDVNAPIEIVVFSEFQ